MQSNFLLYLTALSAVSINNLASNIQDASRNSLNIKTADTNWTLDGNLASMFNQCNGSHQSPIHINSTAAKENLNLRLGLTAYDKPISGLIINRFPSFHLLPLSLRWSRPSAIVSSSNARSFNPYAEKHFALNSIQFYWSTNIAGKTQSSVHMVDDNEQSVGEIHLVHLNTIYPNLEEAYSQPDGLLILAVMVSRSTHESYVFDRILDSLENITALGQQATIDEDSTWRSLLPADTSSFYRYQGSLIMPPCHESVQWVVFEDKLKLGERQLRRLSRIQFSSKYLKSGRLIDWTSQRRPMQPLNNRVVEKSFSRYVTRTLHERRSIHIV